jgi:sulfur-carrier protein
MIRVELPQHLKVWARVRGGGAVGAAAPFPLRSVLDALEKSYPVLRGTIRDHHTLERRAFLRFFACSEDWSHESTDKPLPEEIVSGKEPLLIVGAIAGG